MPIMVTSVVEYLSFYYPTLYQDNKISSLGIFISIIIVLMIFYVNIKRVKLLGNINNGLTLVKIILIIIIISVLLYHFNPSNYFSYGGPAPYRFGGLFLAVSATILAYAGFRQPIDYSEEVKNPGKFIPKAVIISLLFVLIIYMLESIAFLGTVNWQSFGISPGSWGQLGNLPYPFISSSQAIKVTVLLQL